MTVLVRLRAGAARLAAGLGAGLIACACAPSSGGPPAAVRISPPAEAATPAAPAATPSPEATPAPAPSPVPPETATPPVPAPPAAAPAETPAAASTVTVFFSGLRPGFYPTHLHSACVASQAFHITTVSSLAVGQGGGGAVSVPAADAGHGWCLIVYTDSTLSRVLAEHAV